MRTGVATWDEALLLFLERSGFARGDLPHVLLQPAGRRRRAHRRDALRGQRGHRAGHRRAPHGDAAGSRRRRRRRSAARPRRCPPRAATSAPTRIAAVHARLPVRRGRTARGSPSHRAWRRPRGRAGGIAPATPTRLAGRPRSPRGRRSWSTSRALRRASRPAAGTSRRSHALVVPLPQQGQAAPLRLPRRRAQPLPAAATTPIAASST